MRARLRSKVNRSRERLSSVTLRANPSTPCGSVSRSSSSSLLALRYLQSAFSDLFSEFGLNFYEMFAPDFMHEFELGVWKNTFHHLMRLLEVQGEDAVEEFNAR